MIPLGDIHDFTPNEARKLLHNKFVVILGDSIHRSIYKDMIYFLQKKRMLTEKQLKLKTESFANDCLVEGGERHNKTSYCEARQYRTAHHLVRFYFLTRAYSAYVESVLRDFTAGPPPDVVIVNSCLWDLNRYNQGTPSGGHLEKAFREYWQNLDTLLGKLKEVLPTDCLVIWDTAMPLGQEVQHAYLETGMANRSTPMDVLKANFYSAQLACSHALDVLDLHYCFRFLESRRYTDGVHWDGWVHRCITKLLLTHMADAWGVELERGRRRTAPGGDSYAEHHPASSWHHRPPSQPPRLWPRPPPPRHVRPRLPPPLLPPACPWPRLPPPPEPYAFQSGSEFEDNFPPFQFSPSNNPNFQCDFTSDHLPMGDFEFANWEDEQLPAPYPEEAHPDGFWGSGPDAPQGQLFPPYFQPEMPRGAPRRPHNDLIVRHRPFRRHPAAAPYAVPRFQRPPSQEWGPFY